MKMGDFRRAKLRERKILVPEVKEMLAGWFDWPLSSETSTHLAFRWFDTFGFGTCWTGTFEPTYRWHSPGEP